jgi:hypothetical protein
VEDNSKDERNQNGSDNLPRKKEDVEYRFSPLWPPHCSASISKYTSSLFAYTHSDFKDSHQSIFKKPEGSKVSGSGLDGYVTTDGKRMEGGLDSGRTS